MIVFQTCHIVGINFLVHIALRQGTYLTQLFSYLHAQWEKRQRSSKTSNKLKCYLIYHLDSQMSFELCCP